MKIALVQINPVIGDFAANCRAIASFAEQAHACGCELVVFPEMVVSGYPPQDLLERQSFLEDHDRAVSQLISELPPLAVMFGCLERRSGNQGKPLYNSVVVARGEQLCIGCANSCCRPTTSLMRAVILSRDPKPRPISLGI